MSKAPKILIYGYGNPGRQDDGAGIVFTEGLLDWKKKNNIKNIDCDTNYQLNIEDAERISGYDIVFFADASIENINSFKLSKIKPSDSKIEFSMHAVSPAFVLDLCLQIFEKGPQAYLIHIKGLEWDFKEGISPKTTENIKQALEWIKPLLISINNSEKSGISKHQLTDI